MSAPASAIRRGARVAGPGYVALFVLAVFANFVVLEGMVVDGDPAATARHVAESTTTFRLGILAFFAIFCCDIAVAWGLHLVFRDRDRDLSLLAAWFRLTYTVVLGAALVHLVAASRALDPLPGVPVDAAGGLAALEDFDALWRLGLGAFGLHLVVLGVLVARWARAPHPASAPRALGMVLTAAGAAYLVDAVAFVVLADHAAVEGPLTALVAVPSVIGEGWLGLWLLRRARLGGAPPIPADPAVVPTAT